MRISTYIFVILIVALISMGGCGSAHKNIYPDTGQIQDIDKLAVVVNQRGEFEVMYSRATADTTAAAMFGLIGATIASGIDEGQDKDHAASLSPSLGELSCRSLFVNSLGPLSSSQRFQTVRILSEKPDKQTRQKFDAVVTFDIEKWGLRLVDREADKLAGFVELNISMITTADNKTIWDERREIIGHGREPLSTYSVDTELLRNELHQTIEQAGSRMVNVLIY